MKSFIPFAAPKYISPYAAALASLVKTVEEFKAQVQVEKEAKSLPVVEEPVKKTAKPKTTKPKS